MQYHTHRHTHTQTEDIFQCWAMRYVWQMLWKKNNLLECTLPVVLVGQQTMVAFKVVHAAHAHTSKIYISCLHICIGVWACWDELPHKGYRIHRCSNTLNATEPIMSTQMMINCSNYWIVWSSVQGVHIYSFFFPSLDSTSSDIQRKKSFCAFLTSITCNSSRRSATVNYWCLGF